MRTVTVGIGLAPGDITLDLGEFHPVAQGGFQLELELDGEVITRATPRIGFMHRGAEKLFEVRDYRQIMMLANRHDWLAPFTSELGVALALESAMGITPPARATWIRMLLAEITRINAHLAFLIGTVDASTSQSLRLIRESIAQVLEDISGNRVHPMFARIGGVASDISESCAQDMAQIASNVRALLPAMTEQISDLQLTGMAVLSTSDALGFGASGPVGHASGLRNDSRFATPYLFYADIPITFTDEHVAGDTESRFLQLIDQLRLSCDIVDLCLPLWNATEGQDVNVVLPKVVRAPEGTSYTWSEGPTGINGWLLVSAGEKTPWRLKLRSASLNNLAALAHAIRGTNFDRLGQAIKSSFVVIGDVDR